MKTQSLFSILVLSVVLGTACTPRDPKLSTEGVKASGKTSAELATTFNLNSAFSLAAFFGERQLEVIQLIKVASETLDASSNSFYLQKKETKEDASSVVMVSSSFEDFSYNGLEGLISYGDSRKMDVTFSKDSLGLTSLESALSQSCGGGTRTLPCLSRRHADVQEKENYFVSLQESKFSISAKLAQDPTSLSVHVESEGLLFGAKSKDEGKSSYKVSMTMDLVIDRASLATPEVLILSSTVNMTYPDQKKPQNKPWSLSMKASNLKAVLAANCNRLNGSAECSKGGGKAPANNTMVFAEDSVSVKGKDWNKSLAACGERPIVDLSRLQLF